MPNSVKEVLNSALTNVRGKTYLVNDVLTLRGYTAASAAVGPGDTLADIDRWLTNRTKIGAVSGTGRNRAGRLGDSDPSPNPVAQDVG